MSETNIDISIIACQKKNSNVLKDQNEKEATSHFHNSHERHPHTVNTRTLTKTIPGPPKTKITRCLFEDEDK